MTPSPSEAEVLGRVEQLLSQRERVLVALDGRCAAGKTTLARHFQERFGWQIFHMDDFFLRPEQRTKARLAQPGENVDHERFLSEVLRPLRAGLPFQYRPYDCHTGQLRPPVQAVPAPVSLVEGSYACHPALWDFYDLRLFLTITPQEQMSRILARNGPEQAQVFRDTWIPLEERYFAAFRLDSRCDFLLSGSF